MPIAVETLLKSKLAKFVAVVFIAVCLIKIFGAGYDFGGWLHKITH
jgi:hypothetical protein